MENKKKLITIISPAYNESANLPVLYEKLCKVLDGQQLEWEWVIVDDHSMDLTFEIITSLSEKDPRVKGVRLSRNFGSHSALLCGLHYSRGDAAIIIAADLQDPPETIPVLVEKWMQGSQVVWAVRRRREGEKKSRQFFSRFYYFLMRHFVGVKEMPATGADFLLLDRDVINAVGKYTENNVSLFALITWIGFSQSFILYDKQARLHGRSGWSLEKKFKLTLDSILAFSCLPIRLMSYGGMGIAFAGFCYALFIIISRLIGNVVQGWASLMVVILIIGGVHMIMMGVLGEYLWRTLDESRRRPRYIIEAAKGCPRE